MSSATHTIKKVDNVDGFPHPKNSLEASDFRKMTPLKHLAVTQSD